MVKARLRHGAWAAGPAVTWRATPHCTLT